MLLNDLVSAAVTDNPNDINAAVDQVKQKFRRTPDYRDFVDSLVTKAIRQMVTDCRHQHNCNFRNSTGASHTQPKVTVTSTIDECARTAYDYFIAGRTVGSLYGSELLEIASSESSRANGHAQNAKFLRKLAPLVPKDKTVRESVSQSRLTKLMKEVLKN